MSLTDNKAACGSAKHKTRCLIWDWNGTLLDDVALNIRCINTLLSRRGLPLISGVDEYRKSFGFPVEQYYLRLGFDFGKDSFDLLAREYIQLYNEGESGCPLALGAVEILELIKCRGIEQVIISASKSKLLSEQVSARGIAKYFGLLVGSDDIYASSKQDRALEWLEKSGYLPEELLFVGDTSHDVEVARSIGCRPLFYSGGHQSTDAAEGAEVIYALSDIANYINL